MINVVTEASYRMHRQLVWGLEQLCRHMETDDPHVQAEAKSQALVTIREIARQAESDTSVPPVTKPEESDNG